MNAVELGRQHAARLHGRAVEEGSDPWNPLELTRRVAASLGVGIEDLAPDSPLLNGAEALYDPATRTILYADTGDAFWSAFLIGHELGHVTQGDDRCKDETHQADPARAAEAAPVGEDRVIDYSRRSRREVQMDLFARELVFPRGWGRDLHVGAALPATQIAERLGAPFELVAQQLLDALLLPAIVEAPKARKPDPPLNPAQKRAAEHAGGPFLLEAGPGTGKTQTIAARAAHLTRKLNIDPRSILALTFSNKAAGELAERVARKAPEAAAAAWIGTFHGFGLDVVRRFHRELGFEREPGLMDRTEAVELLEAEVSRLDLRHYRDLWDPTNNLKDILAAISRAQDEVAGPERYRACAEAMRFSAPDAAERALEVARVYERYQVLKAERGRIDFGDLVTLPVRLLREYPAVQAELQRTYSHVLVDEYQDVNRSSVELLELLLSQERNLWAVGDARQAIYRFRGASSFNMRRFGLEDFPGGVRDRLEVNYRSRGEIVGAFVAFAGGMAAGNGEAGLHAHRGRSGVLPVLQSVGTKEEEAAGIAQAIGEALAEGYAFKDQAILCSGNERLTRVGADLERRGVPVLHLGSIFERPEIKDLISWLSLIADPRAMGLARQKAPSDLNLSLADTNRVLGQLRDTRTEPMAWTAAPPMDLSQEGREALARMQAALHGFKPADAPWTVLAHMLLDRTRLAAELACDSSVAAQARGAAIWQFMNFLRVQPRGPGLPIRRLLDRIRRLVRLSDERDLRQLPEVAQGIDAVRLMTIHGSKGLEFDVVHVVGLNQGSLPRSAQSQRCPPPDGMIVGARARGKDAVDEAHCEEQECLFYVALSRAKDRLFLNSVRFTAGATRRRRPGSPYTDRLGPLTRRELDLAHLVLAEDDAQPIPVSFNAELALSLAQLELYRRCPRRFFYTHVLGTGGARTPTPFTQMHDAVQAAITEACSDGAVDAEHAFERQWAQSPVAEHAFGEDYRRLGLELMRLFIESRRGRSAAPARTLQLVVTSGTVEIVPDEVLVDGSGMHVARRVRTGRRPSQEEQRLGEAAFALAARADGSGLQVEFIYLASGAEPADLVKDPTKKAAQIDEVLADIRAGRFPMKDSAFTCPSCPAFFICGTVPAGPLQKT